MRNLFDKLVCIGWCIKIENDFFVIGCVFSFTLKAYQTEVRSSSSSRVFLQKKYVGFQFHHFASAVVANGIDFQIELAAYVRSQIKQKYFPPWMRIFFASLSSVPSSWSSAFASTGATPYTGTTFTTTAVGVTWRCELKLNFEYKNLQQLTPTYAQINLSVLIRF